MKRNRITDADLLKALKQVEDGLIDANLGGGLIKQRIARPNQGKSGGFRSILIFRAADRTIFVYGFAKNSQGNIHSDELKTLKDLAAKLLAYNEKPLRQAIKQGALIEVQDTVGENNGDKQNEQDL